MSVVGSDSCALDLGDLLLLLVVAVGVVAPGLARLALAALAAEHCCSESGLDRRCSVPDIDVERDAEVGDVICR